MQKPRHDETLAAAEAKAAVEWEPTTKDKRRAQQQNRRERCMPVYLSIVFNTRPLDLRHRQITKSLDEAPADRADSDACMHTAARK